MQEAEEQDTCRICSAPAEPDQPLFYPCKCSGTIRYIHQDCLTTWLSHSKKKTCDVCKHPYSFTKVYAPDMPARLPPVLLLRRLAQQSFFALLFGLRAITVAIVWLAVLPWVTVWTWRMYFTMGDSTAWWISDRPRPPSDVQSSPFYYNVSSSSEPPTPPSGNDFFSRLFSHPLWLAMSADIFTGQIIASLIVLSFVAIFLLREWISQNARPGVFEDEGGEDRVAPHPQQAQPPEAPAPQPQPPPGPLPGERGNDVDAHRAAGVVHARGRKIRRHVAGSRRVDRHIVNQSKGKVKIEESLEDSDPPTPSRTRRRLHSDQGQEEGSTGPAAFLAFDEWKRKKASSRRTQAARSAAAAERRQQKESNEHSPWHGAGDGKKFEFTFKAPDPTLRESPFETHPSAFFSQNDQSKAAPSLDNVLDQATTPSISTWSTSPLSSVAHAPSPSFGMFGTDLAINTASIPATPPTPSQLSVHIPRRPPLPTTTLPTTEGPPTPPISPGTSRGVTHTPLASPNLATYRAPEDFESGPSGLTPSYFDLADSSSDVADLDEADLSEGSTEDEHALYFQDPEDDEGHEDVVVGPAAELFALDSGEDTEEEYDDGDDGEDTADHYLEGDDDDDDDDDDEQDNEEHFDIVEIEDNWEIGGGLEQRPAEDVVNVNVDQRQPQLQPAPAVDAALVEGDDLDGNVEDDMEGAMEAIGMRGPVYGVVQNAALMIFVLDTAIGLGVWLPFTIGKSTALLSLDPRRFLKIIHFPIRAMRIITDPVVDSVIFLIVRFVLPPLLRMVHMMGTVSFNFGLYVTAKLFGQETADKSSHLSTEMHRQIVELMATSWDEVLPWQSDESKIPHPPDNTKSQSSGGVLEAVADLAEPYFAPLGREVRVSAVKLETTWKRLALGHGAAERTFAVILGYTVVGVLLAAYLNILTVGNVRSAGRAVRSAVRQQLLIVKVASFIVIELALFPLGCGVVLDCCTVWLFPEANLLSRSLFFLQAPLTAMFYHWVAGTMFMYSFAMLLSGCRGIMRPGAMWFIKDPQDQNSHPIRDILDRPTLIQLRKILVSAVMYALVVACVVGSVAGLLLLGSKSVMPFRWKNREPLSDVPIDLLFLNLVLPYTMHYFRPVKGLRKVTLEFWKVLAARLRLTSYMFGDRHPSEEYTSRSWSWTLLIFGDMGAELSGADRIYDGTFRRVPATDNLALPRDMSATAEVTVDGDPIDDNARRLIQLQNAEAEKAKHITKDDYRVVYIPPHFRQRTILFIIVFWVVGALFFGVAFAAPIQLGRSFFKLFVPYDVHDGYSFIVGFYLLWVCFIVGKSIDRMDKRRQRRGIEGPRADLHVYTVKHGLLWLAKISYMIFFLGLLIPILLAIVIELYLILPIKYVGNPSTTPRIRVVDMWCLGILYAKIAIHGTQIHNTTGIVLGIRAITNNGWTHPDPVAATTEVIAPVAGGLIGMILFPVAVFRALQYIIPLPADDKFMFMHVYPSIFAIAGLSRSITVAIGLLSSWSQSIRDKEFLVEMRLRNLEPEKSARPHVNAASQVEGDASDISVD